MSIISKWVCLSLLCVLSLASVACTTPQVYDKAELTVYWLPGNVSVTPPQTFTVTDAKVVQQLASHFEDDSFKLVHSAGTWMTQLEVTFINKTSSRTVGTRYSKWRSKSESDRDVKDQAGLEALISSLAKTHMKLPPAPASTPQ